MEGHGRETAERRLLGRTSLTAVIVTVIAVRHRPLAPQQRTKPHKLDHTYINYLCEFVVGCLFVVCFVLLFFFVVVVFVLPTC